MQSTKLNILHSLSINKIVLLMYLLPATLGIAIGIAETSFETIGDTNFDIADLGKKS